MESNKLLNVMVKDHNRLMKYLKDVEKNLNSDFEVLLKSYNTFEWSLEKHFFVEERAIFTAYNPDYIEDGHQLFTKLSKQHTSILEKVELLRKKLRSGRSIDVSDLKEMLVKHKTYEEKNVYPVLDVEISEGEKRYMIERINDIKIE
jgi:iron-sulfur cluster repair protein YtfE (RIC family)